MNYKLYYFDIRGRAEIIRYVLSAAGVKYEDVRFSHAEWPTKYKAMSPTGVAPFLEDPVTGKTLVQSNAIAHLLATRHGLMSSDPYECYMIQRMLQQLKDVEDTIVPIMYGPEDTRAGAMQEFLETKGPYQLGTLVKFLKESRTMFAVGKTLTLADLALMNVLDFVAFLGPEAQKLIASYPELFVHRKHVLGSNKKLAHFLSTRK